MLYGNKDTLHELVMIGYYGLLITGMILLGIAIVNGGLPDVPLVPNF